MKIKRLLKFYFSADELEYALNRLINWYALRSVNGEECDEIIDRILAVTDDKYGLSVLWNALDGAVSKLTEADRETLARYAAMRVGVNHLADGERREIHRAVVKFSRRAKSAIERTLPQYKILCSYYNLLGGGFAD